MEDWLLQLDSIEGPVMTDQPRLSELLGATDREAVIAEDFAYVLDRISALVGYAEDGNWRSVHEKIGSLRSALDTFERKISEPVTYEDGEKGSVYHDPIVDSHRTVQLITAFAQRHGGRLGPTLFPIEKLENEQAVEQIRADAERTRRFKQELFGDDA
ncbi:hypothetical protein C6N75_00565 [Streptomyces solincola]|uniref:Uncharacterized protein n=1 Tax=Streptomyces solincola TaxID=2100817 RepID=A0A2S9Q325_9ACTN|nr:hypothetical protein [Streptomyces solincola]PRH81071.1 hypothetical protein C6N75_00565 [Streptomyces solincola]